MLTATAFPVPFHQILVPSLSPKFSDTVLFLSISSHSPFVQTCFFLKYSTADKMKIADFEKQD